MRLEEDGAGLSSAIERERASERLAAPREPSVISSHIDMHILVREGAAPVFVYDRDIYTFTSEISYANQ